MIDWRCLSIDTRNMAPLQRVAAVWIETADFFFYMENKIFPWILLRQTDKKLQKFSHAKWKAMTPSGKKFLIVLKLNGGEVIRMKGKCSAETLLVNLWDEFDVSVTVHNIQGVPGAVAYPGFFFGGGVQQIQLRTEDREDGDLGAVAP